MTAFLPRLPDLRRPPDDPRHYLLNADAGWRDEKLVAVELSPQGALQLAPKPGTGRPLADDAGTFGGLDLPTGVAMAADGSLYLLDSKTGQLKRFDPCECRFDTVPCTGGFGAGPRQVADPHGIAIRGGDLFICDTGNRRVQVFALKGMTLRTIWLSPAAAELAQPWQPFDIAFDARGRAFISDSDNGVIHRFDRRGRWQIKFGALNQPTHLAIDRLGRIYVVERSSTFSTGDIIDLQSFAAKLKKPSQTDNVSQFLIGQLSAGTQTLLSNYRGGKNQQLQLGLVADLNRIIQSGSLYEAHRFAGVNLSPDTSMLLDQNPQGQSLFVLNRLLLTDAYRPELLWSPNVAVFDVDGKELERVNRPDKVAHDFRPIGFAIDGNGNLYLGDSCDEKPESADKCTSPRPAESAAAVFDAHGDPIAVTPAGQRKLLSSPTVFAEEGVFLSAPLDSEIYRCQWHRVVLEGDIPKGAAVKVETFTAETTLDAADLDLLPEAAWRTQQNVRALIEGAWDCLITSPPGRFLYLRLGLRSNGAVTPRLARVKVFFPRISLRRYLPAVFGESPVSADFTDRLLAIFDTTHRSVEEQVDNFARYLDPMATPAARDPKTLLDFLTWLGSWVGMALDRSWDESRRRRVLQQAHCLHRLRGTAEGLRRLLLLYLGWEPRQRCGCDCQPPSRACSRTVPSCTRETPLPPLILEHFKLRRWLFVGEARLGDQSVLWGNRIVNRTQLNETAQVGGTQLIDTGDPVRDPFHVYAHKFSVFVPAGCARTDAQRATLQRLIALSKPAHTIAQLELVEPRFRIGFQSSIGFNSVVGRYPKGFTLDGQPLGVATVLAEAPGKKGPPTLEIGQQSRIGTSTILD